MKRSLHVSQLREKPPTDESDLYGATPARHKETRIQRRPNDDEFRHDDFSLSATRRVRRPLALETRQYWSGAHRTATRSPPNLRQGHENPTFAERGSVLRARSSFSVVVVSRTSSSRGGQRGCPM